MSAEPEVALILFCAVCGYLTPFLFLLGATVLRRFLLRDTR